MADILGAGIAKALLGKAAVPDDLPLATGAIGLLGSKPSYDMMDHGDLNQVTWEQRALQGDPRFAASQDVPDFPYAEYARLIGLQGIPIDRPDQVGAGWDQALAADRPCVLEMVTDPNVPPLPPHISASQANLIRPIS